MTALPHRYSGHYKQKNVATEEHQSSDLAKKSEDFIHFVSAVVTVVFNWLNASSSTIML